MTTTTYRVDGLRNAADMALLMERVTGIAGVSGVEVDLRRSAPSLLAVRGAEPLSAARLGDRLVGTGLHVVITGPSNARLQRTFTESEWELHPVA